MIPERFIPKIGQIAIAFSDLDREIIYSIWHLLKCSPRSGAAITGNIISSSTRISILRDLAKANITDEFSLTHLGKLLDATLASLNQRNRLFHDMPYWFSPTEGTVGYFRHEVVLKPKPPTVVNDQWLHELLACINFQSSIFQRFRGVLVVEGEPWTSAQVPLPNRPL